MEKRIVAALFATPAAAERAVAELRRSGVDDERLSVIVLQEDGPRQGRTEWSGSLQHDSRAGGVMKGVGAGAAVGAVAGLVALAIPGLGPFIAAGAIGEALGVAGSAAAVSGTVGAAAGGLAGALVDYGIDRPEAKRIERRLREGGALVTVDAGDSLSDYAAVGAVVRAAGGQTADTPVESSA